MAADPRLVHKTLRCDGEERVNAEVTVLDRSCGSLPDLNGSRQSSQHGYLNG